MILFIADIHLKIGQKNVPRDWAKARYREFFDQLNIASRNLEAMVVGGDIFDRTPSLDELELYFEFIHSCNIPTFIFDGNHEATMKGRTFLSSLKEATVLINPLVSIIDEVTEYSWGTILPYCYLHKKNVLKAINKTKPLFTHVRGEIPPHVKPEIDLDLFKDFPIVYSGDLHSHLNSQLNIVYPGAPMTTGFHRAEVSTGYITLEGVNWTWSNFSLPQLIRKTVSDPCDMVKTKYNHTIYELEGDITELADIENSELLDKKVVKRSIEASLLLDSSMTITDELQEYFLYILELPEDKVASLIRTFSDNIKETNLE